MIPNIFMTKTVLVESFRGDLTSGRLNPDHRISTTILQDKFWVRKVSTSKLQREFIIFAKISENNWKSLNVFRKKSALPLNIEGV